MGKEYFKDLNEVNAVSSLIEKERVFDIRDEKWGHPILIQQETPWYQPELGANGLLYDPTISKEKKLDMQESIMEASAKVFAPDTQTESSVETTEYTVPGCPEEPDAKVTVCVVKPKGIKSKRARCIFYAVGGGLVVVCPPVWPIGELAERFNCVVVYVKYRDSIHAQYPAALNDLHAGYKWMIENAEELGINPKNVVLHGMSSGGHLSLCLGFRLKRYGYSPKGIVAIVPQTDDREKGTLSAGIYNGQWDGPGQHDALQQYLGINFASNRVGPEALANHATVKECIGLPPIFLHTVELDPDRDYNREFYGKLLEAKVYAEYHVWGGSHHASAVWSGVCIMGEMNEYSKRVRAVFDGNIEDCFNYDLRRPWTVEEANS